MSLKKYINVLVLIIIDFIHSHVNGQVYIYKRHICSRMCENHVMIVFDSSSMFKYYNI